MSRVFARLGNVELYVPEKPHIGYREGGHLFIEPADEVEAAQTRYFNAE